MHRKVNIAAALCATLFATAASSAIVVTVEAPGVQGTTLDLQSRWVETFDRYTTGNKGKIVSSSPDGLFSTTYTNTYVNSANQFGGAAGVGNFNITRATSVLTIVSGTTDYFGLWATSVDIGSSISFFNDGVDVGNVRLTDFLLPASYKSNPTTPFRGQNRNEIYAFFNFVVTGGYDRVHLVQTGGGGFENDNQTIGSVMPIPEPTSWLMLTAGFGLVGLRLRVGKRPVPVRAS